MEAEKQVEDWYTSDEMYRFLIRENYHKDIAKELADKYAKDLNAAFKKGYAKAKAELKN